ARFILLDHHHFAVQRDKLSRYPVADSTRAANHDVVLETLADHSDPLLVGAMLGKVQISEAHDAVHHHGDSEGRNGEVQRLENNVVYVGQGRLTKEQEVDMVERLAVVDGAAFGPDVEPHKNERRADEQRSGQSQGDLESREERGEVAQVRRQPASPTSHGGLTNMCARSASTSGAFDGLTGARDRARLRPGAALTWQWWSAQWSPPALPFASRLTTPPGHPARSRAPSAQSSAPGSPHRRWE